MSRNESLQRLIESQIRQEAHMDTIAKASDRIAVATEQMKLDASGAREAVNNINDKMHIMQSACFVRNMQREKQFWMALAILFAVIIVILFAALNINPSIIASIGKVFA